MCGVRIYQHWRIHFEWVNDLTHSDKILPDLLAKFSHGNGIYKCMFENSSHVVISIWYENQIRLWCILSGHVFNQLTHSDISSFQINRIYFFFSQLNTYVILIIPNFTVFVIQLNTHFFIEIFFWSIFLFEWEMWFNVWNKIDAQMSIINVVDYLYKEHFSTLTRRGVHIHLEINLSKIQQMCICVC